MAEINLVQRVKSRFDELGKKPIPAAEAVGLGRTYFTDLFKDARKGSIQGSKLEKVAEACEWTVSQLLAATNRPESTSSRPSRRKVLMVPVVDRVSAGALLAPISQIEEATTNRIALSGLGPGEFVALAVQGNSMNRVSPDGSIIVVNKRETALQHGKLYVFSLRGDVTYKRWNDRGGFLEPYSTEEGFSPIVVTKKRDLDVIGRVRRTILDL